MLAYLATAKQKLYNIDTRRKDDSEPDDSNADATGCFSVLLDASSSRRVSSLFDTKACSRVSGLFVTKRGTSGCHYRTVSGHETRYY